ncbi:MAG: undecaprenyl-diphosphate phosphatase [Bacteroidetes bacterium]|nr:undecaprenyl-diphosphate phosphatase [Bacteroidota bacterium]
MNTIHAIILAIIEGLTEFLPISSTPHMKFANPLIGEGQSAFRDMFEVVIQLAAILSVVVLYWRRFLDFKKIGFYVKLIIALIPAIVFGVLLKKYIGSALNNLTFIACVMIGGGIVLLFIDKVFKNPTIHNTDQVSYKHSFVIGCFQVLSILFPGLSRSAATIIGGLSQKLDRKVAAEFSFFLAVPTMLAASVKSFVDACKTNYALVHNLSEDNVHTKQALSKENLAMFFNHDNTMALVIGCIVSFIVALLAIRFFIGYLQKHGFQLFGYYRIIVGIAVLILIYTGKIS